MTYHIRPHRPKEWWPGTTTYRLSDTGLYLRMLRQPSGEPRRPTRAPKTV